VLPSNWAHYRGLYRHGSNIVFTYTVGGVEVLDMPGLISVHGRPVFTRTIHPASSERPLFARLFYYD
jgi:hypothetical protein